MKLYHYSTDKYDNLKSKNAQGIKDRGGPIRSYNKHISLFLEKIPLNIAEILHHEHSFWRSGKVLFEHEIDTNALPINVVFTIVETPEKTDLIYNKQKWYKGMSDEEVVANKKEIHDMEVTKGYSGEGRLKLIKAIKSVPRGMERYYREMYKLRLLHPNEELMEKYAATVPHLMVYVDLTPIKVSSVKEIELL